MRVSPLGVLMWLCTSTGAQTASEQARKPYIVLPGSAAAEMAKGGSWQPIDADIDGLEARLQMVRSLKYSGRRIDHPEQYFRQYVGVVQKRKKLIYVNAFCHEVPYWRQSLVITLDGGACYWQAFYDPITHAFLSLMINGVA
jgi:hypothetical protein